MRRCRQTANIRIPTKEQLLRPTTHCSCGHQEWDASSAVYASKVDEKAMIRNRYNRIPHPSQTPYGKGTKIQHDISKTAQAESKEVGSYPIDVHQAILKKINTSPNSNRKRTNNPCIPNTATSTEMTREAQQPSVQDRRCQPVRRRNKAEKLSKSWIQIANNGFSF